VSDHCKPTVTFQVSAILGLIIPGSMFSKSLEVPKNMSLYKLMKVGQTPLSHLHPFNSISYQVKTTGLPQDFHHIFLSYQTNSNYSSRNHSVTFLINYYQYNTSPFLF